MASGPRKKIFNVLKGQCHEIFCSRFFHDFSSTGHQAITLGSFRIFWKVKVYHRYQCCWYWWQIMGTLSDCWHLKVNLKEKIYTYVNSFTQRCPNKNNWTFLIKDFFHLSLTPVELRISLRNYRKIRNAPNGIFRSLGEPDSWKNQSKKSRCTVPLKCKQN